MFAQGYAAIDQRLIRNTLVSLLSHPENLMLKQVHVFNDLCTIYVHSYFSRFSTLGGVGRDYALCVLY